MEKSCSECSETTLAQSLCTLCNKWLCYQCTDVHQHYRPSTTSQYQPARTSANQCPDLHQRSASALPATGQGPGSYPCPLLMCHSHRQERLELFCESCDLLCCSSCHLSSHKNHRVVQIEKALQDQQWLFESLLVQVEERRSAVENNAKQIEDRLHGVKVAHRKAENQIKMAKMIMMNELNKRANLLIEQLEKITEDLQQQLEDCLQGAIEMCGQLDHVQKFISWATTHHFTNPILFSRELISLQMQQLLEPSLQLDSLSPVKIRFNWDASYWTKQISTLGQLTVEGGNCTYSQSLSCPSILHPQPISCLALPPVFHRGQDSGCGYNTCCEPQMCCLHSVPNPSPGHGVISSGPVLQRCWDPDSSSALPPPAPCPTISSPVPFIATQAKCTHGTAVHAQPAAPHLVTTPYLHQQHHVESLPDNQVNTDILTHSQCQRKLSICTSLQQDLSHVSDRDMMSKGICEERCRLDETCGLANLVEGRDKEQAAGQHQQHFQVSLRKELQRTRAVLTTRDTGDGRRSTSLEVPMTAHECASDVQRGRLSPNSVCARREKRSQSIPTELAAASTTNPYTELLPGCPQSLQAGATDKYTRVESRQRRASDGVLCVVKENSAFLPPARSRHSPLLTYKTEADQSCTFVSETLDFKVKRGCRVSNGVNREAQKDLGKPKVPVVCLERLKILVSQIPPHGRRQSDPLPASGMDKRENVTHQETWNDKAEVGINSESPRATYSLSAPKQTCNQSNSKLNKSDFNYQGSQKPSKYMPQSYSIQDSASDLRSGVDKVIVSQVDPDCDPNLDSDESEPNAESSSEAELECLPNEKSTAAGEVESCRETDNTGDSEPSLEYEADPESDTTASEDAHGLDADSQEEESDNQVHYEEAESVSDDGSEQAPESQGSVESDFKVDSETETINDDPQPLRSDLEDDSHIGPGERPLLIANPVLRDGTEDVQSEQGNAAMESEDFCAVCLIGGDLLCCDCCPKVYHLSCHIPPLLSFPSGDWVCSLCRDVEQPEVQYDCENERLSGDDTTTQGLSACDLRKCEQLTLLILSNMLSAPFHEPVSPLARHYYQIIKRPMDLSVIRAKLKKRNSKHYNSPDQFVADVYLMFQNCAKFNYPDSEVAQAGQSLEAFFNSKLKEVFPDRVFPEVEGDSDSDEYDEAYKSAEGGFPWPERREQCHRKRKRRHSLKSRKQHF